MNWNNVLQSAREMSLATPDEVPHGRLTTTLEDEYKMSRIEASNTVEEAVSEGSLDRCGSGPSRTYTVTEDGESVTREDGEDVIADYVTAQTPESDNIHRIDWWEVEAETVTEDRLVECHEAMLDYYCESRPDWFFEHIKHKWGISEDVARELGIGYSPSKYDVVGVLRFQGYSWTEIIRAGVVYPVPVAHVLEPGKDYDVDSDRLNDLAENVREGSVKPEDISVSALIQVAREDRCLRVSDTWASRIVFPYYDETGRRVFSIARSSPETGDDTSKYRKALSSKPWVDSDAIDEPLWGVHDLDDEPENLILTEGITDAITTSMNGFDVLSPVTNGFKQKHNPVLADYAKDADNVYIVFDNEETDNGLSGALKTASTLRESGVNAEIVELPKSEGVDKIDLADFWMDNDSEVLMDVFSDSVKPEEHPAYEEPTENTHHKDRSGISGSSENKSAIYSLTLDDVCSVREGYRGDNPINHVGDGHSDYFVVHREAGELQAYCHKTNHGYNALTWLVCECGERSTDNPSGSLSEQEVFAVWKHAKSNGIIPDDDPVPRKAMWHLARHHDLAPESCIPSSWDEDNAHLPKVIYNRILDCVESEYGVSSGRNEFSLDSDEVAEEKKELAEENPDDGKAALEAAFADME